MAKVFASFADGWGRVLRAPAILFGVFAVTWIVVFPAVRTMDQQAPGSLSEFIEGPFTGFYPTFTPTLLGTESFVRRARAFVADGTLDAALVAAAATTLLVWTFLLGGILDRYARRRPTRTQAFFGASGVFFFRFLRLGIVAALGYYLLFGVVHPLLFPPAFPLTAAGQPSPLLAPMYSVFLLAAAFWSAVIDYARIRAVVEDRRSMLGALLAGWRFVTLHPLKTLGLYLLNAAALGVLLWLQGNQGPALGVLAAPSLHLLGRVALRLAFFASQAAFFQRSLAHADYTAAPTPLWPESPAAEEIVNAAPRTPNPESRTPGS